MAFDFKVDGKASTLEKQIIKMMLNTQVGVLMAQIELVKDALGPERYAHTLSETYVSIAANAGLQLTGVTVDVVEIPPKA